MYASKMYADYTRETKVYTYASDTTALVLYCKYYVSVDVLRRYMYEVRVTRREKTLARHTLGYDAYKITLL